MNDTGVILKIDIEENEYDLLDSILKIENNLLEIKHGATGFMLIERDVFDKVREKTDSFIYQGTRMNDYFPCKVVEDNYLTEDYAFCQMWRETGGKIWADMSICLNHEGFHSYQGNPLSTFSTN